jgi:hypothetical protein
MWIADRKNMALQELGERMSPEEFAMWVAFYRLHDPEANANWRAGMIASVIANTHSRRGGYVPQDFMPAKRDSRPARPRGDEAVRNRFMAWAAACGKIILE